MQLQPPWTQNSGRTCQNPIKTDETDFVEIKTKHEPFFIRGTSINLKTVMLHFSQFGLEILTGT